MRNDPCDQHMRCRSVDQHMQSAQHSDQHSQNMGRGPNSQQTYDALRTRQQTHGPQGICTKRWSQWTLEADVNQQSEGWFGAYSHGSPTTTRPPHGSLDEIFRKLSPCGPRRRPRLQTTRAMTTTCKVFIWFKCGHAS